MAMPHCNRLNAPGESGESTAPNAAGDNANGIGVLDKAMLLLNIVSKAPAPLTISQLLRTSGLPRATLHRILTTLQQEGLLRRDANSKTFRLGARFLQLAHKVWSDFDLRVRAQDELLRLRDLVGESVHLVALEGSSGVVIASEQLARQNRGAHVAGVGLRLSLHTSAAGRAMMAWLEPDHQRDLLESVPTLTADGHADSAAIAALRSELALTRSRGYALVMPASPDSATTIAAPVFDDEGHPIGAVALSVDSPHIDEARSRRLSLAATECARNISHNTGGRAMSSSAGGHLSALANADIRCAAHVPSLLGEAPLWSPRDGALYWVDILTPAIHRFDAASCTDKETKVGSVLSLAVPKTTGGLLIATPDGLMTLDERGPLTRFAHPEAERPGNRYNDGKCDRMGRLWLGSMDMGAAPNRGSLFRVDADGSWKRMDTGFTLANGLGWSPDDKRMYFTDSHRKQIYQYDFDLISGTIANRRPFISFDSSAGTPDGLTVDSEGCLWVAMWDDWSVVRFDTEGQAMQRISMPVPRPTSCCFGGPNLDVLYVTSARVRLAPDVLDKAPLSGSLFSIHIPGVVGLPNTPFAG